MKNRYMTDAVGSAYSLPQRTYAKNFLKVFIPLLLLLAIVIGLLWLIDVRSQKAILYSSEKNLTKLVSQTVRDELQNVSSDLFYLANLPQLQEYLTTGGPPPASLTENMLLFSKHRKAYDQIRYLDRSGMEVIRINFDGRTAVRVPSDQLQSKAKRYYFEDTLRLERGDVYVSPLDLNIEGSKIERPLKPMIRFGTPVFDKNGQKRGVIVLNYLGNQLLTTLDKYSSKNGSQLTLLNSEGYWLKGLRAEDEWGFMLPERKEANIGKQFPVAWLECSQNQDGQILTDKGLFTFSTIYPLQTGQLSSTGNTAASGRSMAQVPSDRYFWKMVSFVSPEVVRTKLYGFAKILLLISSVLIVLLAFLARQIVLNAVQREETAALVHAMAFKDTLTGLPNRRLLEDRLDQSIASADRADGKIAVLFLDLDHFKAVNDTLGHEAGDQLLKQVSGRLQEAVRKSDTVARLGGDEFILLLKNIAGHQDVDSVASKVIQAISTPFIIGGQQVQVGTSIGIVLYPEDCADPASLVASADKALYKAKQSGRNRSVRFADIVDKGADGTEG
ncbi:MAG: sensor domain-containing diguanylate cyclase [Geobacteraceae bacterium]|nr:sensor domain-containing diguanylate cyclase [Geobacteraceae bacterium]